MLNSRVIRGIQANREDAHERKQRSQAFSAEGMRMEAP